MHQVMFLQSCLLSMYLRALRARPQFSARAVFDIRSEQIRHDATPRIVGNRAMERSCKRVVARRNATRLFLTASCAFAAF